MITSDTELRFQITGMDWANCARSIESGAAGLPAVQAEMLRFMTGTPLWAAANGMRLLRRPRREFAGE